MKIKNFFTSLIIYLFFPIGIVFLGFNKEYILLLLLIIAYFTVFYILKKENIFRILAGYYDKNMKYKKSLKNLYRAYKVKSSSITTANTFIYMLLKTGNYDKCGEIIKKVEEREMTENEREIFLSNKALYLWKKNKISESIKLYEELIKRHESTAVYSAYGYIVTLGNDLEKALEVNLKAYDYHSGNKAILDNLGLVYIKLGQLDKAYDIYTTLMKKSPTFPEAYYNFAMLFQIKRELTEAKYYLNKALTFPFNGLSTVSKEEVIKKLDYIKRLQGNIS